MTSRDVLRNKLEGIIHHKLGVEPVSQLRDDMKLNEELRLDSIMLVQLIVYIEMELEIWIPEDEIDPRVFTTVGSLLDFIEALRPVQERK